MQHFIDANSEHQAPPYWIKQQSEGVFCCILLACYHGRTVCDNYCLVEGFVVFLQLSEQ